MSRSLLLAALAAVLLIPAAGRAECVEEAEAATPAEIAIMRNQCAILSELQALGAALAALPAPEAEDVPAVRKVVTPRYRVGQGVVVIQGGPPKKHRPDGACAGLIGAARHACLSNWRIEPKPEEPQGRVRPE